MFFGGKFHFGQKFKTNEEKLNCRGNWEETKVQKVKQINEILDWKRKIRDWKLVEKRKLERERKCVCV